MTNRILPGAKALVLGACVNLTTGCMGPDVVRGQAPAALPPSVSGTDQPTPAPAPKEQKVEGGWGWLSSPFKVSAPLPPADSFSLRADGLVAEKGPDPNTPEGQLAGGRELFRRADYAKAESVYHRLAENTRNPPAVAEEARYYEAECLRLQGRYLRAADTYNELLKKFERSRFKDQALQHMYDIANYWLDETRQEMRETREVREGKRWMVTPRIFHFDKTKPFVDNEGYALQKLEQIRLYDIHGPLADRCLFLMGSVKFYRGDYREAEHNFSQIYQYHKDSKLAPQAVELAIISKHLSTGGSDYDGRKSAEARALVHAAFSSYPELAEQKKDFLTKQLVNIHLQQADKDFKTAQFYERFGHPGSAYFYYGLVVQRYANTPYAEQAKVEMERLKAKHEVEQAKAGATPSPRPGVGTPEAAPPPRPLPAPQQQLPPPREGPPQLPPPRENR